MEAASERVLQEGVMDFAHSHRQSNSDLLFTEREFVSFAPPSAEVQRLQNH